MTEEHVEVTATVRDRHGQESTVYAGSMPAWVWAEPDARKPWTAVRRKMILADLTSDPRGWRVTFTVTTDREEAP